MLFETVPSQLEAEAICELISADQKLKGIEVAVAFSCKDEEHLYEGRKQSA